ncbi:MAG: EthD family reductase [Caulobacter sp.]|nr:EthD family reductase [Caulobacter sp.]
MFKRMSVLVRRQDHDRSTFSRLWERHAAPVSQLPKVCGYVQNHVEEDFSPASPISVDGFVELLWDRPEDMADAFASPAARPMVEDEPGFLGHGSGYALRQAAPLREADRGKLIVAALSEGSAALRAVETATRGMNGLTELLHDQVVDLIAKPGMAPPQPLSDFFHLWFDDPAAASDAGRRLAGLDTPRVRLGVYRVRTIRFV